MFGIVYKKNETTFELCSCLGSEKHNRNTDTIWTLSFRPIRKQKLSEDHSNIRFLFDQTHNEQLIPFEYDFFIDQNHALAKPFWWCCLGSGAQQKENHSNIIISWPETQKNRNHVHMQSARVQHRTTFLVGIRYTQKEHRSHLSIKFCPIRNTKELRIYFEHEVFPIRAHNKQLRSIWSLASETQANLRTHLGMMHLGIRSTAK